MSAGILGLWDGHGAGVAVVAEGRLVFALSEERPSRRKRHSGFPRLSLALALEHAEREGIDIQSVAIAGARGRSPLRLLEAAYAGSSAHREPLGLASRVAMTWENRVPGLPLVGGLEPLPARLLLQRRLGRLLALPLRLHPVDHHDAHAYGALLGPGREDALVLTADAYGEGRSGTLRRGDRPEITLAHWHDDLGLALLYGAVTVAMGFSEGDEGKVMGLAATGDPSRSIHRFRSIFADSDTPRLRRRLTRRRVARLLAGLTRADAAAALQACVEQLCERWVRALLQAYPARRLHLAGGLFANVRINQVLAGLPGIEGLFVFPAMGDEGLAAGAAHALWRRQRGSLLETIDSASLGVPRSEQALTDAARDSGLRVQRVEPASAAVGHLEAGRVLCRYTGRDEYGPRALGDSSILFRADRPALSARVNQALGRDPIMAFAPIMTVEAATEAVRSPLPARDLGWMTITTDAAQFLAERCPVAVHVDGTARPQLVTPQRDPALHTLLAAWHRHSGQPALINTSFNLHGEPIVHGPGDAVRSFVASGLDVLMMGEWEITRRA